LDQERLVTAPWRTVEVPDGVLPAPDETINVSPTQLSTFKLCPRKWALGTIAGIKAPQPASAALGEAVHALLERWLEHGELPANNTDAGAIALSMLQHEPTPKTVAVEQWLVVPRRGYNLRGRGDAIRERPALVVDHKTTSDIATWAKTPEVLERDEQAVVYAAALLERDPSCQSVEVRFVYGQTKGARKAKPVTVHLSRQHVDEVLRTDIDPLAQDLVRWRRTTVRADDLPRNPTACDAYGGCYYRTTRHCTPNPEDRIKSMAQQSMLAGLLAQSRASTSSTTPAAAPTPINPPAEAPLVGSPPTAPASTPSLSALLAGTPPAPVRPSGLLAQLAGDGYYQPEAAPAPAPLKVAPAPKAVVEPPAPAPVVEAAPVVQSAAVDEDDDAPSDYDVWYHRSRLMMAILQHRADVSVLDAARLAREAETILKS
jgi:hypothetical protein